MSLSSNYLQQYKAKLEDMLLKDPELLQISIFGFCKYKVSSYASVIVVTAKDFLSNLTIKQNKKNRQLFGPYNVSNQKQLKNYLNMNYIIRW